MNCSYCKREMHDRLLSFDGLRKTRDHYIPVSRGGTNAPGNIRLACYRCNSMKGDMMPDAWEQFMSDNPCWWWTDPQAHKWPMASPVVRNGHPFNFAKRAPNPALAAAEENGRRIKAYMERKPTMRPLRKDEPIPKEFDDPRQQAAFEAYAQKYRHVLRVPAQFL